MDLADVKRKTKKTRITRTRGKTVRLPHELVAEILSRLPVEDLWPLRCVNKTWLRLLARDPQFAKLHFDRSIQLKTRPGIIAPRYSRGETSFHLATDYTACDTAIKLELPFYRPENDPENNLYTVLGICNGLLCISNSLGNEVYIWNPTINDHITIPCSPTPSWTDTVFAFGFHQGTNTYKVIICKYLGSISCTQFSVCTLGIDSSWRTVGENMQCDLRSMLTPSPVVNGVVHWLGTPTMSSSSPLCTIVGLHLGDEFLQELPIPKYANFDDESIMLITELGGQLCMFCAHEHEHLQIWVMKEYGLVSSWTELYKIGLGSFSFFVTSVGFVAQNGDVIVKKDLKELILYHPNTNSITSLAQFGFDTFNVHTYVGSIISPRLISGAGHIKI